MNSGFIQLHRKMLDWEWFTDINACHLFLYCLLRANYKNTEWHGVQIKKGQFVTSYSTLSAETGLTIKQVRVALDKLKRASNVAHEGQGSYSIITVKNWSKYQIRGKEQGSQRATDNKDNKSNKRISNIISLSINDTEREILKNYVLRQKRKPDNLDAYINTLIKNGDWREIVKFEKERLARIEENRRKAAAEIEVKKELTPEEKKAEEEKIKAIHQRFYATRRRFL